MFTQVSLGYDVGANLLTSMVYDSRYIVEECWWSTMMIFWFQEECQIGGLFANQHGCGRCTQTGACIEDGLRHDRYSSMPKICSLFELNKYCPTWWQVVVFLEEET